MSTYEYWIGKDVDYHGVWDDFENGSVYIRKFATMEVHLFRLTFEQYPINLPLYNHEAIYKTVKGYFHDLKKICLSPEEYGNAGPLFFYSVDRGSGIWEFLGELRQLVLLGTSLAEEKIIGQQLDNYARKLSILDRYFGVAVRPKDFDIFMKARTPNELSYALRKLYAQRISRVEISQIPFRGNPTRSREKLIELKKLLKG